jgi:nitroimidazol reductase NimA-like FMN-containing flavoprotein (pyridoxamine 5'-phosphate oxidase superfamily)
MFTRGLEMNQTTRTELRRMPARGSHDCETIYRILDAGFLASVGFCKDGQPFVIPTLYGRKADKLYLHGSAASRLLGELEAGIPVCVSVTLVDGLVLARSAFHHSMNYRSVVAFGTARSIEEPLQKIEALRIISENLVPGRWNDVRGPSEQELRATKVLEFSIDEASAKVRTGPPLDDASDYGLPVWAGVLPLTMRSGAPIPDERLADGAEAPDYVLAYDVRFNEPSKQSKA